MIRQLFAAVILALALATPAWAQPTGPINITAQDAGNCATANACAEFQLGDTATLAVDVSGTFSATLTFEASANNRTTWRTVTVTNPADLTTATTTTAAGTFVFNNAGFTHVRLRAGTYASGTAIIYGKQGFQSARSPNIGGSQIVLSNDTFLVRDSAGSLSQRNSTTAQKFNVCNTWTSSTNFECATIDWQSNANVLAMGAKIGTAGGTGRVVGLFSESTGGGGNAALVLNRNASPFVQIGLFGNEAFSVNETTGATGNFIQLGQMTATATSGTIAAVAIVPTYNEASGTAANTDLLINRTQTAIGSGVQYALETQIGGTTQFSVSHRGTVALRNKCTVTVDGATTFALSNTAGCSYIDLQCTGAETINTITGGVTGTLLWILNGDTECTIADDDVATAANAIDLTGAATNDVGAVAKVIGLIYDGASWMQLFESDN